ncbi:LacI family DNA-binding transcriptional regulator [Capillimicrobium parvum]|uniref:LacI family DNA-binding transcriptional regulator n=1 Tax=Capillimicrobium parvum TaxID=2884022 RepID=UPI00216AC31C|nr:LacI family DNA-binding transcriptional regulator [Capillimicrobium parvum]
MARLAGVSPATVSRVLNGVPNVREEYRERVMAAVAEVDYRPNRLAQNLRRQKAEVIGVVVSDIENPHFSEAVRAIEDASFRAGYRVMLCNTDETAEKQRAYLQMLADERVLGAIVSPADREGAGIGELLDLGIPIVCFDRTIDDPRVDAVTGDNVEGVRRATEHLLWLGHERIAYLGGRRDVETGAERLEGYLRTMRDAGHVPFAMDGGFRADTASEVTVKLLRQPKRASALLVANNLMTLGALRAVRAAGLRVPEDIALVGVDDPPWASLVDPPLTTVAQPVREMAQTAMSLLLERIRGTRTEVRRVVMPLELRVRDSCGMSLKSDEGTAE